MTSQFFFVVTISLFSYFSFAQTLDLTYFTGNIARHDKDIAHLITHHPEGILFSYSQQTSEADAWAKAFNYPDVGTSLIIQNFKNNAIGTNMGIYRHYNFYFWNRKMVFRLGQGVAYASKAYHKSENYRNLFYGTHIIASTYAMLNYDHPNLWKQWGVQAGIMMTHYSNASFKSPNKGVNTLNVNFGIHFTLNSNNKREPSELPAHIDLQEKTRFQIKLSSGINEGDIIESGQYPFFILSASADKRLNRKSALQLGTDFFVSYFLKEQIKYSSIAYPEGRIKGDEDFLRLGIYFGHELFINKWSLIKQVGYYIYSPSRFESDVYFRGGLKRYFNKQWFGSVSVKTHGFKAEALEWGIGIRF
jgi:hypothetical protein